MKEQYKVVRNIVSKELVEFIGLYFLNLQKFYTGELTDQQVMNTPSYGNHTVTETLMVMILDRIEQETGLKLYPTYSYLRIYKKGDELKFHTDREACEISCTINLKQSHHWPIHMDGQEVILEPGDGCIYKGMEVNHGRYTFEGDYCIQVFCHYVNTNLDHIDDQIQQPGKPRFITNLGKD